MAPVVRTHDRAIASLLMAAGVVLLGIGLLSYGSPALREGGDPGPGPVGPAVTDPSSPPDGGIGLVSPGASPADGGTGAASPGASPTPAVVPSGTDRGAASPDPGPPSPAPGSSPSPAPSTPAPLPGEPAPVTRVVIDRLRIDLPVLSRLDPVPRQGPDHYPPCDVALFHDAFSLPGETGTTYVYAHAQPGMFLSLLEATRRQGGDELIGRPVLLYTDDDRRYRYEIVQVKRHALDFSITEGPPDVRQVVLQTSEGPFGTFEKVQVRAVLFEETTVAIVRGAPEATPAPVLPGLSGHPIGAARAPLRSSRCAGSRRSRAPRIRTMAPATIQNARFSKPSARAASLMPKMPASAPTPASTAVTAVSRFMTSERLLLTVERYASSVVLTSSR